MNMVKKMLKKLSSFNNYDDKFIKHKENSSSSEAYISEEGDIKIVASNLGKVEITKGNNINLTAYEINCICNNFGISVDDIIINNKKINKKIFNSDMTKDNNNNASGAFSSSGFILVKTWSFSKDKYVFVRRRAILPICSHKLPNKKPLKGTMNDEDIKDLIGIEAEEV